MEGKNELVELTAEIVAAYVGNNPVPQADLPRLISEVYKSLSGAVAGGEEQAKQPPEELKPAVPIRPMPSAPLRGKRSDAVASMVGHM